MGVEISGRKIKEKSSLAAFEKMREEKRGVGWERHRRGTDFKIKQVLLFWKMNGGCRFVFGRRMEIEKLLF